MIMQKTALEGLFLIDIETVSERESFHLLEPEWQELWSEKINRSLPPDVTAEEYYHMRAAILAEFAKVVCISFGYFKKVADGSSSDAWQLRIKSFCSENEEELLKKFVEALRHFHANNQQWIFTGHNIKEFDVPFLSRRMIINNIPIPPCIDFQNMKPWETPVLDTLHLWRFGDYKHYTSLKLLAATLGVPSPKDDIDGSEVGNVYWKEKNLERISIYCEKDVATVANVILRFKGLPLLKENQIVFVDRNK
jgi:DNA polymerase elongation subunit (family B)